MHARVGRRALWLFVLGLLAVTAFGVPAQFVHLSVEQGLSQSTVQAILQDHVGFLWFGTEEGLNRYDGYNFLVFKHDPAKPNSLPDNVVSALFEDSQHRMWIGTEHGLCTFDRTTESFTPAKVIQDRVTQIMEATDGTIWVAAVGGGLFLLPPHDVAFKSYQPVANDPASLGSFQVAALLQDHKGRLWIGTRNAGIDRFEPRGNYGAFIHHRHRADDPTSLGHDEIWGMAEDHRGTIWVATYGGGLDALDPDTGRFRHYRHRADDSRSIPTDLITAVFVDRAGEVWVGTDGAGLLRYDANTDRFMSFAARPGDPQAASSNVVRTIYEDTQGQIWIGTFTGGVSQLKPVHPAFAYFTHDDADPTSVSDAAIACLAEDPAGGIWLGTEGGWINHYDRATQTTTHYRFPTGTANPAAVLTLHWDRRGRLWAGSYRAGLARFDPQTAKFTVFRHDPAKPGSISNDEVWRIAEDRDGILWLATNAGVDRFDPDRGEVTEHLERPNAGGYSFTGVRALEFDRAGNLWVGNFGGLGMRPAKGGEFVHYQHRDGDPHSLANDAVVALHFDAAGTLWVGTLGGGLCRLDPATGEFTTYHGFPSNVINAIEEDTAGKIWVSTNHGLSRLDPVTGKFESYDLTNGLQSLQFHLGAGLRTRGGRLLFGSMDGFYDLDPAAIQPSTYTPKVVLTDLRIFNAPALQPGALPELRDFTLHPADKIFSVEFAALDYTFPRRNRYEYQLEGFSDRWIQLGDKRELTFTNLAPRDYTLRIRASNSDGVWSDATAVALRLAVLPPVWATWWFRSGAVGLLALGLVVLHRRRVHRLTEKLTERRQTELALRESEERFSRAFRVSPVPMCIVRLGARVFVDVNDAFAKLVGYRREELIGRSLDEVQLVSAEERERAKATMLAQGGLTEVEFRLQTKTGEMRTVLASIAITSIGGQPCALGVGADITERERAEQARRDSEERYRRFFDDDLAGAFICRTDGTIVACNPAFARMFGFTADGTAIGSNWFELSSDPASTRANLLARLRRESKLQDIELEMRRRDGGVLHVQANLTATVDELRELTGINGYVIDLTERKKLEAQLLQSQKMEAVGQLAGGVAHDFNNLLTGIIGYTDLLLMDGKLDEESCASLQEIRAAGSRAAALTRQLLAFSRRQLLQPRVIDLNVLVREMENMLRRLIGEDIALEIVLGAGLGRVRADRSQIEQVIMNLSVNARDAMPQGGRLTIETSNVSLDEKYAASHVGVEPGNFVRLAVSDTGCGMDPEIQARIFEPFFTTKSVGKGTGLGLSTVYGIVKQSNGHIALYSEKGTGSTFKIYLPRIDASAAEDPMPRGRPLPRGNETVLLVEDNEVVRKATAQILRQNGYQVIEASEPAEALEAFARALRPVHLLLTDVIMPGMNGRELATRLTARAPALRVMYMSGYTDDAISRHGGLSGDVVYLEKPFAPDTLIGKVQEALRQRPPGAPKPVAKEV